MKKVVCIVFALVLVFSLSINTFAADGSVTVNGSLQNMETDDPTVGGDGTFDVTIPTSVYWYVTNTSYPNIVDGNATGPATVTNSISNNSTTGAGYKVALVSFTGDAAATSIASQLTLNLTGDLANDGVGAINLSGGYSTRTEYTTPLAAATPWTFGFAGTFSGPLSTTAIRPAYTMTLNFALN